MSNGIDEPQEITSISPDAPGAKIRRSRRKELLQIGRGSKTIEQSRGESAERQTRSKANKKARAVTVTAPASEHAANETDLNLRPSRSPNRQIRWRHSRNLRSPVIFGCRS